MKGSAGHAALAASARSATGGAQVLRLRAFQQDSAALVAAAVAGDVRARRNLYQHHVEHVRRVLVRCLGSDHDLADAIQDVFLEVFRNLKKLREPAALKRWVTRVTVFVARARIRKTARKRWLWLLPPQELPEGEAPVADAETAEALRDAYAILDKLPADERIAFALRIIDGMELKEVADACNCSLATIKRRLRRAQDAFLQAARQRETLQPWLDGGARWK